MDQVFTRGGSCIAYASSMPSLSTSTPYVSSSTSVAAQFRRRSGVSEDNDKLRKRCEIAGSKETSATTADAKVLALRRSSVKGACSTHRRKFLAAVSKRLDETKPR